VKRIRLQILWGFVGDDGFDYPDSRDCSH
jgi:hypothetical protein